MQSAKMQGPASPSMVPDASIVQSGAAKSKPGSAVLAQNFPTSGETTSIESKVGERSMKSSWIRRLKPRDELELSKGKLAEATSEMTHPDEYWDAVEKMDRGVRSTQPACFSGEKASTKTDGDRARPNLKNDAISNSEMQKVSEQQDCGAVDRQITGFIRGKKSLSNELGKDIAGTAAVLPSSNGFGPWLNLKNKAVLDTDRQKISDQKDRGAVDTQRSGFVRVKESLSNEVGKESATTAAVLPSSAGFGPWVNLSSGRKPGGKPCLELERVGFSPWNVDNVKNTKLSMQVLDSSCPALSSNNAVLRYTPGSTQGETMTPVVSGKPPLPPIRSKPGLPPRPLSRKTKSFLLPGTVAPLASGMSRGFLDQHTQGVHSSGQILETSSSRESVPVRQVVSMQLEEMSKLAETKHAKSGSPFQKPRPLEGSFPDSTKATSKECGKGTPDCGQHLFPISSVRKGNNEMPSKHLIPISVGKASISVLMDQQIGECSDDIATQVENDKKEFCEGSGSALVWKRSFEEEIGDPKVAMSVKSLLETASMEPKKTEMQQSPSESSHGTAKSDRADASASTTASLPWEMFIEAAGASKKAREQFVEVYNRARDELKNQRTSQITSRAPSREMDDGPRLTLGPGTDVPAHFIERQSLKHQEHSAGHFQSQGRHKALSTSLDHRTQSRMNPKAHLLGKEQQTIGLAEGKGRVTVPASKEAGLQGDNVYQSNLASPCKLTEGFRKGQMRPMEQQHRVNLKASQGSDQDKACQRKFEQRSDALAQVHNKGVRSEGNTRNEGQAFSNNAAVNYQQLGSKLKEHSQSNGLGQGAGSLSEHNNRQEMTTPLLGKRPRGTFEDHAVSRVAEKGPITRRERPSRPHIWLQRWHPATIHDTHNPKGMPDAHVLSGVGQGSVRYLALGLKKFKDGDGCRVFGQATEVKNTLVDKEQGLEGLKMRSAKMLPSAAAMAIVGTAARQFCSAQPQRKGSFAFWSGFGMPAPQKLEPSQGKGKAKLLSETDP